MENNEIAAKRHKKRKTYYFYAPFASFRGYSLFPLCRLCCGLVSTDHTARLGDAGIGEARGELGRKAGWKA
jgi:hypothetical protein